MERWGIERFGTAYVGGGTPSLLPSDMLGEFLLALRNRIGRPREFTVEANPESLDKSFLEALGYGGVDRLSLGVQTYDEGLLSWLGRPAGSSAVREADSLIAEEWKGRLSRDLLAGLPRQQDGLLTDIVAALEGDPGHLSLYELTVEPETPLSKDRRALAELPDENDTCGEWENALNFLGKQGYERYEISNFCRPGQESVHNMGYWRLDPYLGMGPGAVSTLPGPEGPFRRQEPRNLVGWLADTGSSAVEEVLTASEFALEHFMMALRTLEGLSVDRFRRIFGHNPISAVERSLEKWRNNGILEVTDKQIRPTAAGMDLIDAVLVDIASEIDGRCFTERPQWPPS